MKALGVLEIKWDPIRKKLASRLIEDQGTMLRAYLAPKGGTRSKGGDMGKLQGREHVHFDMYVSGRRGSRPPNGFILLTCPLHLGLHYVHLT
jgi:hypothetical protein